MIKTNHIPKIILCVLLLFPFQISMAKTGNIEKISILIQNTEKLTKEGKYEEALKNAQKALSLQKIEFGSKHYSIAESLGNLAIIYYHLNDFKKADYLYEKIIEIYKTDLGPKHIEVGIALSRIALLCFRFGNFKNGEELCKKALIIFEKIKGIGHPSVVRILNNLEFMYFSVGEFTKAEKLYKKYLNKCETILNPEHPTIAMIQNNLGMIYLELDNYESSEEMLKKALVINKKLLGPEHVNVANNISNLAACYYKMNEIDQAKTLYEKALAIVENKLEDDDPFLIKIQNNLAVIYANIGEYSKAEQLHLRVLTARENALKPNLFDIAQSLNNIGAVYNRHKNAKAEEFLIRALKIHIKIFGEEHSEIATAYNNLAYFYKKSGKYKIAQEYYEKSLKMTQKILGLEHSIVSDRMINLAVLYASQSNFTKAFQLTLQAQKINNKLIDHVMGFSSDNRKLNFSISKKLSLQFSLNFLFLPSLSHDLSVQKDILNVWLKRKGLILETKKQYQEALFYSDDKQVSQTAMALSTVRSKLSKLVFSTQNQEDSDTYKNEIAQLEKQKEELEATLSKLSKVFATEQKKSNVTCVKLAQTMPSNTVLVDFARISQYDFKNIYNDQPWLPDRYLAFVIHAGNGDKINWVDLGPADKIDNEISAFRKVLVGVNTDMTEDTINISNKLYSLIFKPLKSKIGDTKEIYISPDGNLSLLPFEVFQDNDGKFLIENYTFNYLSAGRDILGFGEKIEKTNKSLIMGNPDFNMNDEQKIPIIKKLGLKIHNKKSVTKRSQDLEGNGSWQSLPGTMDEVQAIYDLIGKDKADLFTGEKAIEETLMFWGVPKILHLATHGFFLKDKSIEFKTDGAFSRGFSIQFDNNQSLPSPISGKTENPLLRSGIVLAGANTISKLGDGTLSDGIVTAEEILGMDLRGTEMVVLSACDTGLGEIKNGEGVFGLRRAFTQAGAKSLVMSMWKVPDKETKELMVNFYSNIYNKRMDRCQALRQAILKQIQITRQRYGKANPYYWGAFVFMGEP